MLCASVVTSTENRVAAVSKITCRNRGSAVRELALRLTITTSAQDGSATSARTTADPTCPVPPIIKTRNAIWVALSQSSSLSSRVWLDRQFARMGETQVFTLPAPELRRSRRSSALGQARGSEQQIGRAH